MFKRLIIALRVDGWSGQLADQRLDHRIRYPEKPDDSIFGADTASDVIKILNEHLSEYSGQHRGIRS
jgi:hypothetical protein